MPVIKHADQRVGVFIDTQNLYHSAKNLYQTKVDFGAVLAAAVSGRILIRAIAYVVSTEGGEEKGFFDALAHRGIETKSKELQVFSGGVKKGDWDVGLAMDVIKMAPKLDTVVLATADGDFAPLIEYLQSHGCQVEVIAFGRSTSQKLKDRADDFIDMDSNIENFLIGAPQRTPFNRFARNDGAVSPESHQSENYEEIVDPAPEPLLKKRGRPRKTE